MNLFADTEQLDVQERGAPGDRQRQAGAHLPRALLQPQGQHPHLPGAGAGHGRRRAAALPADDLRRVQALHQEEGRQGQGADRGSQGPGTARKLGRLASSCVTTPVIKNKQQHVCMATINPELVGCQLPRAPPCIF